MQTTPSSLFLYSLQLLSYSLLTRLVLLSGAFFDLSHSFSIQVELSLFSFIFILLYSFLPSSSPSSKWWMCVRRSYFLGALSIWLCVVHSRTGKNNISHVVMVRNTEGQSFTSHTISTLFYQEFSTHEMCTVFNVSHRSQYVSEMDYVVFPVHYRQRTQRQEHIQYDCVPKSASYPFAYRKWKSEITALRVRERERERESLTVLSC
jgi:hypothetical protein